MRRRSPLLLLLLMVPLACDKQATTTPPSEPVLAPVETESSEAEDAEADELDEMSDEELDAELDAEMGEDEWGVGELETGESGGGFGGRGSKVPNVQHATATVTGSLDRDIIRRIVRAHINEIRSCYNAGLSKDGSLAGKVTIEFTIAADGFINASQVVDSELADATVGECMVKAAKKWQFPKPSGGGEVQVLYPFLFDPG